MSAAATAIAKPCPKELRNVSSRHFRPFTGILRIPRRASWVPVIVVTGAIYQLAMAPVGKLSPFVIGVAPGQSRGVDADLSSGAEVTRRHARKEVHDAPSPPIRSPRRHPG